MGFQTSVNIELGFGIPGELYDDGPVRCQPAELVSASAAYNVVGATAFTMTTADPGDGSGSAVAAAGGTGAFAGILMNPKVYANVGAAGAPLTNNMALPNYFIGELLTMGDIVVSIPGPASIGDRVCYDQTTGQLSTFPAKTRFTGILLTTGVLTVTAMIAGQVQPGMVISGAGLGGATIVSNGTGVGGAGTYQTDLQGIAISAEAMSGDSLAPVAAAFTGIITTGGILTVSALTAGELAAGQIIYGTGLTPNPVIIGLGTGTGSTGTYTLNQLPAALVSATAMTANQQVTIPRAEVCRFAPAGNQQGNANGVGVIKITN